jgi:hypothetical protein
VFGAAGTIPTALTSPWANGAENAVAIFIFAETSRKEDTFIKLYILQNTKPVAMKT